MKKLSILIFVVTLAASSFAQGVYDDFIYNRQAVKERRVVSWPYLREADVLSAKRIVRVIDVREKQNQVMAWPKNPLSIIIYNAILNGKLIPYYNDSLSTTMTIEEFRAKGTDTEYVEVPISAENPDITEIDTVVNEFRAEERIKKFKITEDWIFDKKHSTYFVRIICIAPLYKMKVQGFELPEQELCVLKYHSKDSDKPGGESDIRHQLINYELFNRQNDAARLSYDDWFEARYFSSYIVKQSNEHDLYIREYAEFKDNGVAAILEGEKIKQDLFEKEHDLWEY